ncbi:hypothetical protein M8C21_032058, partial [Ambrosia artemisiifolia]
TDFVGDSEIKPVVKRIIMFFWLKANDRRIGRLLPFSGSGGDRSKNGSDEFVWLLFQLRWKTRLKLETRMANYGFNNKLSEIMESDGNKVMHNIEYGPRGKKYRYRKSCNDLEPNYKKIGNSGGGNEIGKWNVEWRVCGLKCDDMESAVATANILSCATNSTAPLALGKWLKAGAHLDLVGSYKPSMRECDDEAVKRGMLFERVGWGV